MDLVVTAVALGASAGLKDVASAAITDAYGRLKWLLGERDIDVSVVEQKPESAARRSVLQETLADAGGVDDELVAAAEQLTRAVATEQPRAAAALGVDLTDVRTAFVRVRSIDSTATGFRANRVSVDGGIDLGDVRAGRPGEDGDPPAR